MNLLFYVTFSWLSAVVVSFKNSLQIHLRKDVADPRVNTCCKLKVVFGKASLVFGQTVVWNQMGVYIKLKVSWLPAFLWCMSQTSRDLDNSRRVLTHEKNSGDVYRRFLCPIRNRHLLEFLEMVRWESVTRGSFALTWKLSSRLFSRPDWLPLGLRECPLVDLSGLLRAHFFPTIINILEIAVCRKGL